MTSLSASPFHEKRLSEFTQNFDRADGKFRLDSLLNSKVVDPSEQNGQVLQLAFIFCSFRDCLPTSITCFFHIDVALVLGYSYCSNLRARYDFEGQLYQRVKVAMHQGSHVSLFKFRKGFGKAKHTGQF